MKKVKIVLLVLLLVIIGAVAALGIWQWQNINAVVDGIRYDENQLEEKAQQSEKDVTEYLENNNIGTIRPLTEEEAAAVTSGEITEKDAVKISTGKMTLEQAKENKIQQDRAEQEKAEQQTSKPEETKPSQKPEEKPVQKPDEEAKPSEPTPSESEEQPVEEEEPEEIDYDTLISEKVAQLYIVKANFYAEFNAAWAAEKAKYLAIPKSERRGYAQIAEIVKSKMGEGVAMEKRYDAQVDTIIAELKQLLTEAGRDTELADSIREAYNQEKKAKKAQLINKYFGKL